MLKIAIIGMGGIGNTHARCYVENEQTDVAAVCDCIAERADEAAEAYGAKAFYNVQEMLDSDITIDAASVATAGKENGGDHYEPTMQLLGADIPVLGEKPISNEIDKAAEMVALARARNLPYAIDLNHRFTPAAARAREWIDEGRLGELQMIRMMMWISNPNESSPHFHIRALHPHSLDVMRYFCGDVAKVQAFFKKGNGRQIWSNLQVNLLFENGVIGNLMGSYDGGGPGHVWGLETCEVIGHQARFMLHDACELLEFQPRHSIEGESYRHLGGMASFGDTFQSRIDRWIEQLRTGTAPDEIDGSGADALKVQQVIEAAIESWETDTVVSLNPQV